MVAISNDETGISEDPTSASIASASPADHGIPTSDIVVDPLRCPSAPWARPASRCSGWCGGLREELVVNTTCGASNVSFGRPAGTTSPARLAMAIGAGMTSAIMNPLHPEVKQMIMAADVLAGNDEHCAAWIRVNRDGGAEGDAAGRPPPRRPVRPAGGADVMATPSSTRTPRWASASS